MNKNQLTMRKKITLLAAIFLVMSFVACKKDVIPSQDLSVTMLEKVNKLRSTGCKCGTEFMPPVRQLVWNIQLAAAAQNHANDMFNKNYFDHISPTGSIPIQRAQQAGYTGTYVMENIGHGYATIDAVFDAWQESESHCRAMMDSMHTAMGAANEGTYWVQEFGKP